MIQGSIFLHYSPIYGKVGKGGGKNCHLEPEYFSMKMVLQFKVHIEQAVQKWYGWSDHHT